MKRAIMVVLLAWSCSAMGQATPVKKAKAAFHSINQLGILEGQRGTAFQVQTINGFRYRKFFAGAGIGLDYYQLRSVPVFLDVRQELLKKDRSPFVYADAGWHFPWGEDPRLFGARVSNESGPFYELGLGFRIPFNTMAFLFSAGYSYKAFSQEERYQVWCMDPPCEEQVSRYDYRLRRLSLRIGFSF